MNHFLYVLFSIGVRFHFFSFFSNSFVFVKCGFVVFHLILIGVPIYYNEIKIPNSCFSIQMSIVGKNWMSIGVVRLAMSIVACP